MIYSKLDINSVTVEGVKNLRVNKSMSDYDSSSNFSATIDSPYGKYKSTFNVGDIVEIYSDNNQIYNAGSPTAQWTFNTSGNYIPASVGTEIGSTMSGVTWSDGLIGSCVQFNGLDSRIVCSGIGSFMGGPNPGSSWSISVWVNSVGSSLNGSVSQCICTQQSVGDHNYFLIGDRNGTHPYDIELGLDDRSLNTGSNIINLNQWNHIVATCYLRDVGSPYYWESQIYHNGKVVASGARLYATGEKPEFEGRGYIGWDERFKHAFNGKIDDLRFYNRIVTPDEVTNLYNNSSGTEKVSDSDQKLFLGVVEKVSFKGEGNTQNLILSGKDYSTRLTDVSVDPVVYTDSEISTIVKNIIQNNVTDITTNNVDVTDVTLKRISFNHTPVYDALRQLAQLAGYVFYIDNDKDLHFEKRDNISSGIEINNENILKMPSFNQTREGMSNIVWVYGDRQLVGFKEILPTGSPTIGSEYTLINKPHNTYVEYQGNVQKGGILDLVSEPASGTNYLVSFQDRKIVFISGTEIGDSIPASGGSILVQYDREIPIVKTGQDRTSIALYGPKEKVINDSSIKDPNTAGEILQNELQNSDPFRGMEFDVKGWHDLTPGNTVGVVLNDFGIDESNIGILNLGYTFDVNRNQSENVLTIRLDKRINDITDQIMDLRRRLDSIEAQNRSESELITRLEQSTGSFNVVGSHWEVRIRSIAGDGLIWGNDTFGIYGSGLWRDQANVSFILGNPITAILGTSELGTEVSTFQTIKSGGYY